MARYTVVVSDKHTHQPHHPCTPPQPGELSACRRSNRSTTGRFPRWLARRRQHVRATPPHAWGASFTCSEATTAASASMTDAQLTGETVPLPAVVSGEVQTASNRDPIEDFNMDEPATGDNVFGMSDRDKKYNTYQRIKEENPDMSKREARKLAKAEFTKSQQLAEAQAESPAKGGAGAPAADAVVDAAAPTADTWILVRWFVMTMVHYDDGLL